MSQATHSRATPARRISLLSAAIALALIPLTSHAEGWVSTKTKAFTDATAYRSTAAVRSALSASTTAVADTEPVEVVVSLKLRNENQLDQYISYLQSGGSRQYLSPAQFTAQYAPTQAQVDQVVAHLRKAGYSDISVAPNRLLIKANGTAANVHNAFNTTLKRFVKDGRAVYANASDAQVPQSLGGIVESVQGLQNANTFHTFHHEAPLSAAASPNAIHSNATSSITGHNPVEFSSLYGAGTTPNAANTAVGIVTWGGQTQTVTDLNTFTSKNGLASVATQIINIGSGAHSTADLEWQLDSQSIVGAAGGAVKKIIFYNAPNNNTDSSLAQAFNRAVTDNVVKVINASFGGPESSSFAAATDPIFKQAIAQGITVAVSSGDEGVYENTGGVPNGSSYSVSSPTNSPYVISVGGTTLSTGGYGVYSGETVWNEGLAPVSQGSTTQRLWATGGGYSTLEAAPSWQTPVTGSAQRAIPDVAFDAASSSGAQVYYQGSLYQVGGTSLAAPIFSGIWARLQSANNNGLGFPAASFYKYFPVNTSLLNDVTSGNNGYGSYPGYAAKAGWDATTGFGSFNIAALNSFIQSHPDFSH